MTETVSACVITADSRTLSLTSDATLQVTGNYIVANRVAADPQTLRVTGRMLVKVTTSRAPAVPCSVDLTVTYSQSKLTGTATGSVCGTTINRSVSWSP